MEYPVRRQGSGTGFIRKGNKDILATATTAEEAVMALLEYQGSDATFKLEWANH